MTALSTDQFRAHVRETRPSPDRAGDLLARLRGESARPESVVSDPLAPPGGDAGEQAERDRLLALRRQLKVLLAGNKLHVGLMVAALEGLAPGSEPPAEAVTAWIDRAGRWVEAAADALARRWNEAGAGPDPAAPLPELALSGYHRYELARTLVSALQRRPALLERAPDELAAQLAAPAPALPPEAVAPYRSAGPDADRALAWSRALARVAEAAADAPFGRPPETVLADARAALTEAVAGRVEALDAALALPEEARRIAELHVLQTAGRLYAATLRHVHGESARMIERYQSLQAAGKTGEADDLARDYQDSHWGYAGVGHHFRALLAAHLAQQDAALAALERPKAPASPDPDRPAGGARKSPDP